MKVKSESEVTQLCPTLTDPMDYSLPGSSIHGIFQARVLEWVAIDAEKAFDNIQHPFMINRSTPHPKKAGIEGTYINIIKAVCDFRWSHRVL